MRQHAVALQGDADRNPVERHGDLDVDGAAEIVLVAVGEDLPENVVGETLLGLREEQVQIEVGGQQRGVGGVPRHQRVVLVEVEHEEPDRAVLRKLAKRPRDEDEQPIATPHAILVEKHLHHEVPCEEPRRPSDLLEQRASRRLVAQLRQRRDSLDQHLHRLR